MTLTGEHSLRPERILDRANFRAGDSEQGKPSTEIFEHWQVPAGEPIQTLLDRRLSMGDEHVPECNDGALAHSRMDHDRGLGVREEAPVPDLAVVPLFKEGQFLVPSRRRE